MNSQVSMPSQPPSSDRESSAQPTLAEPTPLKPLVLLRDTERSLRVKTVGAIAPFLPEPLALNLGEASGVADQSLDQLAEIDLESITDAELKPARIQVGLVFLASGALAMTFLLMCLCLVHSELSMAEQVYRFWHQSIWFAGLGIAGLFMIGREFMRPVELPDEWDHHSDQ